MIILLAILGTCAAGTWVGSIAAEKKIVEYGIEKYLWREKTFIILKIIKVILADITGLEFGCFGSVRDAFCLQLLLLLKEDL